MKPSSAGQDQAGAEEEALANFFRLIVRIFMWPYIALIEIVFFPWRLAWNENDEYIIPIPRALRFMLNSSLEFIETDYVEDVKLVWSRVIDAYKLGFAVFFRGISRVAEWYLNMVFTGFYIAESGTAFAYAAINAMSPCFDIPVEYGITSPRFPIIVEGPHGDPVIDHPFNTHFMIQFARLAYEHPAIVKDVICAKWKLKFDGAVFNKCGGAETPSESIQDFAKLKYRPDSAAYICSNEGALIIAFRGNVELMNWRSDATPAMFQSNDIGSIHAGFYSSLFEPRENCLFDQIVAFVIAPGNSSKKIFVTGHGIGGAMASVFAQTATRTPDIQRRIKGIYTFGQPRTGNNVYRDHFDRFYAQPPVTLRFVHASDARPKLPSTSLGYVHHTGERFITSTGKLLVAEEKIADRRIYEDRFSYFLWIIKFLQGPSRKGYVLGQIVRLCLFPFPGICDGLPSVYENSLRNQADTLRTFGNHLSVLAKLSSTP